MATVLPFRGLLYNASRIPDLKSVVAPPYDVISAEKAEALRSLHPNNIVHADLPSGDAPAKYAEARALLDGWRESGVLERDGSPAVYVTSQRYSVRGMPEKTRWGFLALLKIEDDAAGVVLPHEKTMDAPRRDRLELSAATRMQVSPIFVVYSDPAAAISGPIEALAHRPPDRWVSDDAGVDTRLWRLADPETLRTVCSALAGHKIWIADGHHRYAAARELRDRLRAADPGAAPGHRVYDYVLAYFSNVDAPGLTILPYHRVLKGMERFDVRALTRKAETMFDVKNFSFEGFDHRAEQIRRRLRELSDRGRLAVALYAGGAEFHLCVLKPGAASQAVLAALPEPLRGLDVSVLHQGILEAVLGISPEDQRSGRYLRYTEEVEKAIDWVDASEANAAFLLNMPRRQQMMAVAEAGLQMPQKSTFFYPKVLTGLVLQPLDPVDEVFDRIGRSPAVAATAASLVPGPSTEPASPMEPGPSEG